MLKTLKVLKRGETLAMLFDQNAGGAGTRLSFMGRECSCTTLPDILDQKYKPRILLYIPEESVSGEAALKLRKWSL